jgi:Kef-type K+ transport system membrane component KefB
VYALVSELIGLSAIVGAFLAGVALKRTRSMRSKSFREGAEYVTTILASIFFVSLGVLVDLRQVPLSVLPFVAALTLVALVTKFVGCGVAARLVGMGRRDSALVGAGMAPRGEVALIVALLALQAGAVQQDVYVTVVLMSLLTTLVTPPLLRRLARPWFVPR